MPTCAAPQPSVLHRVTTKKMPERSTPWNAFRIVWDSHHVTFAKAVFQLRRSHHLLFEAAAPPTDRPYTQSQPKGTQFFFFVLRLPEPQTSQNLYLAMAGTAETNGRLSFAPIRLKRKRESPPCRIAPRKMICQMQTDCWLGILTASSHQCENLTRTLMSRVSSLVNSVPWPCLIRLCISWIHLPREAQITAFWDPARIPRDPAGYMHRQPVVGSLPLFPSLRVRPSLFGDISFEPACSGSYGARWDLECGTNHHRESATTRHLNWTPRRRHVALETSRDDVSDLAV